MRRVRLLKHYITFVGLVTFISCLLISVLSFLRLPETSSGVSSLMSLTAVDTPKEVTIGRFGEMMIEMLPEDLAFTIFVPSDMSFERDLGLRLNDSLVEEKMNDTYAILTRVLGFTTVPRRIFSDAVPLNKEINFDSLSGLTLYISKDSDGSLIVNRVRSDRVDLVKGVIVVHVMKGVVMEADFEQSVRPDNEED